MTGDFGKLYGNEKTRERLAAAVRRGTLAHALLISGPEGSGRQTLVTELAAALNCESLGENRPIPCGLCNRCRRIYEGQFPDFKILEKERSKATIGVEQIREFREDMFLSATESDSKVYVIKNAETMTPAAQNSLLKVIEEPPPATYIILIANGTDQLLSTIKSRAQYVQMERFPSSSIEEYLLKNSSLASALRAEDKDAFEAITLFCSGVIGQALSMLDDRSIKDGTELKTLVTELILAFRKRTEFSKLYSTLSSLPQTRPEFKRALEVTLCALRDVFTVKSGIDAPLLFFTDRAFAEELTSISAKRLVRIYEIVLGALSDLDKNVLIPTLITDIALAVKETT